MLTDEPLTWNDFGPGWDAVEAALSALQSDLTRTVPEAPTVGLMWADTENGRFAYVGKAPDWYGGATEPCALGRSVGENIVSIAAALQDTIVDNLFGYRTYWPRCPFDRFPLFAELVDETARWVCHHGEKHTVATVGRLGRETGRPRR